MASLPYANWVLTDTPAEPAAGHCSNTKSNLHCVYGDNPIAVTVRKRLILLKIWKICARCYTATAVTSTR